MKKFLFTIFTLLLPILVTGATMGANGIITSISLINKQQPTESSGAYWNGEEMVYPLGHENYDLKLNFLYTIEQGIYSDYCEPTLVKEGWNYPGELLTQLKNINSSVVNLAADYDFSYDENGFSGAGDFDFVDGRFRSYEDSVLIRVSPANADLTNTEFTIVNTEGEDLVDEGFIDFVKVKRYIGENGLWVVKFKLNDSMASSQWESYASYLGSDKVYAVAVKYDNNTQSIASDYGLSLETEQAKHAYDFTANDVDIDNIKNRYVLAVNRINSGYLTNNDMYLTDDSVNNSNTFHYELTWHPMACGNNNDADDGLSEVAYSSILFRGNMDNYSGILQNGVNACNRHGHTYNEQLSMSGIDNRHLRSPLPITFSGDQAPEGEDGNWARIDIEFPSFNQCGERTPIRGFFVTMDQHFAIDSDNSEMNAWPTYITKNVAKYPYETINGITKIKSNDQAMLDMLEQGITLQEGNKGTIWLKDARNLRDGDVIGFRVHAVNLDGTFTDPDGRAFYVKVGNKSNHLELSFHITAANFKTGDSAVQDLVSGKNPIAQFNKENEIEKTGLHFFERPAYGPAFGPDFRVVYTWRADNPAIRAEEGTDGYIPMEGTGNTYGLKNFYGTNHTLVKALYDTDYSLTNEDFDIENFFDFWYSTDAEATIDGSDDAPWAQFNEVDEDGQVAPSKKTLSMKAAIKAGVANRLIDGATYKITMTIMLQDVGNVWRIVNTYDIDITKVMPTDMPAAFGVKSNQLANGKLNVYVRPLYTSDAEDGSETAASYGDDAWKIYWNDFATEFETDKDAEGNAITAIETLHGYRWATDVRPYTLEEIFRGLIAWDEDAEAPVYDENYIFVFEMAGNLLEAEKAIADGKTHAEADAAYKAADAYSVFNENFFGEPYTYSVGSHETGAYNFPKIHWSNLDKAINMKAGYFYRNISANLNENGTAFMNPSEEKVSLTGLNITNADYQTGPIQIKSGNSNVVITFKCAFDASLSLSNNEDINMYDSDNDIVVDAGNISVKLRSEKWYNSPNQAYINTQFGDWQDTSLSRLIADGYYYVDPNSVSAEFTNSEYSFSDYYKTPYLAKDANGTKLTENDSFTAARYIVLERDKNKEMPAVLRWESEAVVSFDIYDIWYHKQTLTIPFTLSCSDTFIFEAPDVTACLRQKIKLPMDLMNKEEAVAYQFDLTLPDGFTLAKDSKGQFMVKKTNRYEDENQVLSVTQLENGSYRFICFSLDKGRITGKSGPVLNIYVTMDHDMALGNYQGAISNIVLTKADQQQEQIKADTFVITVNDLAEGDSNGDGELNVSDIVEIVNYIMQKPSGQFVPRTADLNGDGDVNVTDIVVLVDLIMAPEASRSSERMQSTSTDNDLLTFFSCNGQQFSLWLTNEATYVASQFDIRLSNGHTLESVTLNKNRASDHLLTCEKIATGQYRVVVFSMTGSAFRGDSGELLNISVKGQGEVSLENILFVTADAAEKRFADLHSSTTAISTARRLADPADVYTTDGRVVRSQATSLDGLRKGVYIVNGKKEVVK